MGLERACSMVNAGLGVMIAPCFVVEGGKDRWLKCENCMIFHML